MAAHGAGPWYNRPARPFPALVWLRARYPFLVPAAVFARQAAHSARQGGRRAFPAKVWLISLDKS